MSQRQLTKKNQTNQELILAYLQEGETLINIAKKDNMPSLSTLHKWIREDEDYSRQVENARAQGALYWVEQAMLLTQEDLKPQEVMWAREKISTWKWLATKLLPQFSDRQHITSHNKHEVVQISWMGAMAKCPECGYKDTNADG